MQTSPLKARAAVAAIFFVHGFVWGNWAPHIPLAMERLGVGPAVFGAALLAIAGGGVVAMPLSGLLINHYGSAAVTRAAGVLLSVGLILPIVAPGLATFVMSAIVFGAGIGSMDVAMNAHGLAVEKELRKPTMSFFHATYSIGCMVG